MARPRAFSEAAVLDAAIECFWRRGYEATSVRDLAASMGIAGASLYNAFGDKRGLYQRALERYVEGSFVERAERLENSLPPRQAIAAFFDEVVRCSLDDTQRKGCMLINSAIEVAPHDADMGRAVAAVLTRVEAFFLRCVEAGQSRGAISAKVAASDLARLLLSTLLGLRVLARSRPEPALLEGVVRPVMLLLDDMA